MAENIILEGGKGGGGSSFSEKDNTLRSNTYVATLEALGYGLQLGPVEGLKSVYLDDTPLYGEDGTANFKDVMVDFRVGTPSQTVITGFEETGAPITVATDCVCPGGVPTPVTRTVSSATVDAVAVTIRLPQGLSYQDTGNNTLSSTVLEFDIKTKLTTSGTWTNAIPRVRYNDKTTSAYEESFRIERPAGTGTWDIRIERVTPDSTSATLKNTMSWAYFTEYDHETITYPNVALMGITLNASGVNATRVPTRSVDWYGRIIQIPDVLDPNTRTFSGVWDLSTFQNKWCNDPAWVLYDLATDTTVGLGLDPSEIDVASFYEASIYNSEQVSFTGTDGNVYTTPRYNFNAPVTEASTGVDWLKRIAATMNATVLWVNGQLTLIQDRPDTFKHVFTNANVVDGRFTRAGTPDDTRYTVCNVTWNAPDDGYKQRVTSVEDTTGIANYGFLETNVAAFGCTSMSQAIRFGKWILDSSLYTTTTISFTTGEIGAVVIPGDVIRVYDNTYAGYDAAGRLLAGSTTSVLKLDRPISLSADATITIWGQDGTLFTDVPITTTGTASTITLTTPLAAAPAVGSIFQITTNSISPELYRVIDREETEDGKFTITAGQYDPNKWSRIEGGVALAPPRYTAMVGAVVQPPTGLTFNERSVFVDLGVQRKLHITWTPVPTQVVSGYRVTYTMNGGNKVVTDVKTPGIEIDVQVGLVMVTVQALSYKGIPSRAIDGTYSVLATETTGSVLNAPTNLGIYPGGGSSFTTRDLVFQWTNPTTNGTTAQGVVRFKVEIYTGTTLLRSDYVAPVAPGETQAFVYSFDDNIADGGPRRSLTVKVYCQDASRKLSAPVTAVLSNPTPVAPTGLSATGGIGQVFVNFTLPSDSDYKGTLVWMSQTSGFTPGAGNLVYDGSDSVIALKQLGTGVHYLKVAHYDSFGKDSAGTGLNLSSQLTATPLATAGIPSGSAAPGTGTEGDLFYNTTDGKLYRYHSGAWTTAVPTVDLTGTISTAQIANAAVTTAKFASGIEPVTVVTSVPGTQSTKSVFNTTDSKLYRWNGSAYVATTPTTDLTGTISASQIAANAIDLTKFASGIEPLSVVSSVPGTLSTKSIFNTTDSKLYRWNGSSYIATVPTTDLTGTISSAQLAANSVDLTKFASGIEPLTIVSSVPGTLSTKSIFNNADGKVYRWNGSAYVATMPTTDLTGTIASVQIANAAVTTAKFASGIEPVTVVTSVPGTFSTNTIFNTGDDKLYRWNGSAYVSTVPTSDLTGTITTTQITDGAISTPKLASNSVTTNKLVVTGRGQELNADPNITDITAWITAGSFVTGVSDLPSGGSTAIQTNVGARTDVYTNEFIPVDQLTNYRAEIELKQTVGTAANAYLGIFWYDAAKTSLVANLAQPTGAGYPAGWANGSGSYFALYPGVVPTTWTTFSIAFGPDEIAKIPSNARYCRIGLLLNYNNTASAVIQLGRAAILRKVDGNLVVDGSITASKIAANTITAGQLAAGSVTTSALLVTSKGQCINDDPALEDLSAWILNSGIVLGAGTTAAGAAGNNYFSDSGTLDAKVWSARVYSVDPAKTYSLTANLFAAATSNRNMYIFVMAYDRDMNAVTSIGWGGSYYGYVFGGVPPLNVWSRQGGQFGAGTSRALASNIKFIRIGVWFQYSGVGSVTVQQAAQDIRLESAVDANLVVDGAISTDKLAANAVTAAKIAANTITASEIAAGTITSTQIAADTITAGNIAAGAVSTSELAANAVTAAKIAANTITAGQIAANTITAGQIAAGAIGASEISAGAITTKALLVTGNNLVANSDFATGDFSNWRVWAAPSNQAVLPSTDVTVPAGAPARYVCKFYFTTAPVLVATFAAVSAYSDAGASQDGFDVLPGNVYDVRIYGAKTSDYAASFTRVMAYFWKSDGTYTAYLTPITITPTTSWAEYTGSFVAPAGAVKCWLYVISSGVTAGSFFWTRLRAKERVNADLIVDGAITASKIAANTITANEIAAGTISTTELGANAVTAAKIAANTITAGQIAANTITAGQIAAGAIGASEIAAGAITTDKLFVTGRGKALNDDPACMDSTAWTVGAGSQVIQSDTTAPVGTSSIRTTNGTQTKSLIFPVEAGKTYKISLYAKKVSGSGTLYIRLYTYSAVGTLVSYLVNGLTPSTGTLEAQSVPSTWTRYTGYITPGATSVNAQIFLHSNWNTTGVTDLCDIRAEEYIGADLIVDGAITASKIAADTITAAQIAANAITSSELAANSVIAGKIAASAVTANEIAANTITASKIAAGTLTATEMNTNLLSADNVLTRSVTVRDPSTGAVIFGSGTNLDFTKVSGSTKPENNATVGASAVNFTGSIGGDNRVQNSEFENRSGYLPYGFAVYNNGGNATAVASTGITGNGFGIKAGSTPGSTLGLTSSSALTGGGVTGGVEGLWKGSTYYVISFYAKKVNGAGFGACSVNWNTAPASTVGLANPNLSTSYQRYAFRILTAATPEAYGRFYFSAVGTIATNDEIHFDRVQIQEGDVLTDWTASRLDLVSITGSNAPSSLLNSSLTLSESAGVITIPGSGGGSVTAVTPNNKIASGNISTYIAGVAISDAYIANLNASKINAGYINAARIQAGTIDASKITVGGVSTLAYGFSGYQLIDMHNTVNTQTTKQFDTGVLAAHTFTLPTPSGVSTISSVLVVTTLQWVLNAENANITRFITETVAVCDDNTLSWPAIGQPYSAGGTVRIYDNTEAVPYSSGSAARTGYVTTTFSTYLTNVSVGTHTLYIRGRFTPWNQYSAPGNDQVWMAAGNYSNNYAYVAHSQVIVNNV